MKGLTYSFTYTPKNDVGMPTGQRSVDYPIDTYSKYMHFIDYIMRGVELNRIRIDLVEGMIYGDLYNKGKPLNAAQRKQQHDRIESIVSNIPDNIKKEKELAAEAWAVTEAKYGAVSKDTYHPEAFTHFVLTLNKMRAHAQAQHSQESSESVAHLPSHPVKSESIAYDKYTTIGVSESQGRRPEQEDSHVAIPVGDCSPTDAINFLMTIFKKADTAIKERNAYNTQGSTATVAYLGTDNVLTCANAGDSRAVLLKKDKTTGEVTFERLTLDHKPGDVVEETRIRLQNGKVTRNFGDVPRVDRLSMSRGFGDPNTRVLPNPDITQYDLSAAAYPNHDLYLMVSCDGLYENRTETTYAKALEDHLKATPDASIEQISDMLTKKALESSRDNITLLLTKIEQQRDKAMLLGVFDGHGGSDVSKFLGQSFAKLALKSADEEKEKISPKNFIRPKTPDFPTLSYSR